MMPGVVANVVLGLAKGQVGGPVQSRFGWHIVKLEDSRDLVVPPYDAIKESLTRRIQQAMFIEQVKALRKEARIE